MLLVSCIIRGGCSHSICSYYKIVNYQNETQEKSTNNNAFRIIFYDETSWDFVTLLCFWHCIDLEQCLSTINLCLICIFPVMFNAWINQGDSVFNLTNSLKLLIRIMTITHDTQVVYELTYHFSIYSFPTLPITCIYNPIYIMCTSIS